MCVRVCVRVYACVSACVRACVIGAVEFKDGLSPTSCHTLQYNATQYTTKQYE